MMIHQDSLGQYYAEFFQRPPGATGTQWGHKRAWIGTKASADWHGGVCYLRLAATSGPGTGPVGRGADFPLLNVPANASAAQLQQILTAAVTTLCMLYGYEIP